MSHVSPGLVAEAGGNQLVVAPHRAIEEDQRRAGKPGFQLIGDVSAGGKKIEIFSRRLVADPKPERVARAVIPTGMKLWRRDQLLAQIWRRIDEIPVRIIGADRNRSLGALVLGIGPRGSANRTSAIPLRDTTTCRGAQDDDAKHDPSPGDI